MSGAIFCAGIGHEFIVGTIAAGIAFVGGFVWIVRENAEARKIKKRLKEAEDLEAKMSKSKAELETLEQRAKEIRAMELEVGIPLDIIKNNTGLKNELEELLKRKAEAESELEKIKDACEKSSNDLKGLDVKLTEAQKKVADIGELDKQITAKQKQLADLGDSVVKAEKRIADLLKTIGDGLDRLEKMNLSGVQTLRQEAFAQICEPVFSIAKGGHAVAAATDEGDAFERVKNHFGRMGFEVPDRLLAAFHASLKTSGMSSLTVMAGVSGTGKSALPKLYSEAMGIFFQPLAVEPRWDSPKDLFGFFNYATNRYEPTALARALFQFQSVRPGGAFMKGWGGDMSEYMLMPMLDEMNLARVEYYFSELLSKLELRRIISPITPDNAATVAMEIFQGWRGTENGKRVKEEPIRLYADMNTLFVGTMNEDETTQSLSDKVIDRANVLYFGRPNKLQPVAAHGGGGGMPQPLKASTWNSWIRKAEAGKFQDAEEKLGSLNRVLEGLNRPFAHRTFQAMLSYVANYFEPGLAGNEPKRINRALADQIGMRVMPKLRGLDLAQNAEVLEQVGAIVSQTGDAALAQAFAKAKDIENNRSGFFQWTGFDWQ